MAKAGKILILELYDKLLSMLIQDNNILSIHAQRKTAYAVGDIYIGKVQNISKNIDAAFVDIGNHELTFLSMAEAKDAVVTNRRPDGTLKTGDEVLVQIVKEPIKTKLAGVTARIALSGNYAVVGVGENGESRIRVSSKLSRKQQNRFRAIDALQQTAKQYQVIVRTNAGELQDDTPLSEEVRVLSDTLGRILKAADNRVCYSCLYRSEPGYINFVKNAYRTEFDEVITDIPDVYEMLRKSFCNSGIEIRFYEDKMLPLYKLYAVETRVKEIMDKKVWLKSGGYLVIEPTEALISIDVNTGKCENGRNQEETFLKINLEAAEMIARQLRARNLSGMILVDFINLKKKEDEAQLIEYMRNLLKKDSVTASVIDMTGLGLMEITRKKVNPSFAQQMMD